MATTHTAAEMRKMQPDELQKEIAAKRSTIAKKRIGIAVRSEKDSASFGRDKKELARLLTVQNEKSAAEKSSLKAGPKASTVPVRRSSGKSRRASASAASAL